MPPPFLNIKLERFASATVHAVVVCGVARTRRQGRRRCMRFPTLIRLMDKSLGLQTATTGGYPADVSEERAFGDSVRSTQEKVSAQSGGALGSLEWRFFRPELWRTATLLTIARVDRRIVGLSSDGTRWSIPDSEDRRGVPSPSPLVGKTKHDAYDATHVSSAWFYSESCDLWERG